MFYIEDNKQILLFNEDKNKLIITIEKHQPQYKELPILETAENEVIVDFKLVTVEEAESQKAKEEAEKISKLSLTRADVFRGVLKATGKTKNDIKQLIELMSESTPEEIEMKELARIDFEDSLNFYRGVPIVDILGKSLGFTKEQLDNFFIKGNDEETKADAWMELVTLTEPPTDVDQVQETK